MKRLAIPLASYIAVTIVVPMLNGAPIDAAFLEHAVVATALPLLITGAAHRRQPSASRGLHLRRAQRSSATGMETASKW